MIGFLEILLTLPAMVLLILAGFFLLEVFGALMPSPGRPQIDAKWKQVCVVIPAHNEGEGVVPTIKDAFGQLKADDRVIVVADNCSDNSADVARAAGAECLERHDEKNRGKGYALQYALDELRDEPPTAIFFVDADCRLGSDTIALTVNAALQAERPAQALYLMLAPKGAGLRAQVSEFAWCVINEVRMKGLFRLFDTTRLTGAGMVLPWSIAKTLHVGSGEIVEDLSLSLVLTRKKQAPIMVSEAIVTSEFPTEERAAAKQRARWEHGSLSLARRNLSGLFFSSVAKADIRLSAMALDLAIPPLTLFGALLVGSFLASMLLMVAGIKMPFWLTSTALVFFCLGVTVAWLRFGREALPPSALKGLFGYVLSKRNVYGEEARQSTKTWTRTARTHESTDHDVTGDNEGKR